MRSLLGRRLGLFAQVAPAHGRQPRAAPRGLRRARARCRPAPPRAHKQQPAAPPAAASPSTPRAAGRSPPPPRYASSSPGGSSSPRQPSRGSKSLDGDSLGGGTGAADGSDGAGGISPPATASPARTPGKIEIAGDALASLIVEDPGAQPLPRSLVRSERRGVSD